MTRALDIETLAGLGQGHAPSRPVQQAGTEPILERCTCLLARGLGDAKLARRPGREAPSGGHFGKYRHARQPVHINHLIGTQVRLMIGQQLII